MHRHIRHRQLPPPVAIWVSMFPDGVAHCLRSLTKGLTGESSPSSKANTSVPHFHSLWELKRRPPLVVLGVGDEDESSPGHLRQVPGGVVV